MSEQKTDKELATEITAAVVQNLAPKHKLAGSIDGLEFCKLAIDEIYKSALKTIKVNQ